MLAVSRFRSPPSTSREAKSRPRGRITSARSDGWRSPLALLPGHVRSLPDPVAVVAPAAGILAPGSSATASPPRGTTWTSRIRSLDGGEQAFIAFNLADVWALTGILALVLAIGVWLIRNRDLLPPTHEVRATRGAAFRRLFQSEKP